MRQKHWLSGFCALLLAASAGAQPWQAGPDNTPGWKMMTPEERSEHIKTMHSFTSLEACQAYLKQHRDQMQERAKSRHMRNPGRMRHDPCQQLKAMGQFKPAP